MMPSTTYHDDDDGGPMPSRLPPPPCCPHCYNDDDNAQRLARSIPLSTLYSVMTRRRGINFITSGGGGGGDNRGSSSSEEHDRFNHQIDNLIDYCLEMFLACGGHSAGSSHPRSFSPMLVSSWVTQPPTVITDTSTTATASLDSNVKGSSISGDPQRKRIDGIMKLQAIWRGQQVIDHFSTMSDPLLLCDQQSSTLESLLPLLILLLLLQERSHMRIIHQRLHAAVTLVQSTYR